MAGTISTLMYHDVVRRSADESGFRGPGPTLYKLDWAQIGAHFDALEAYGAPLVASPTAMPRSGWMLTFDDGGASSLAVAEALHERGWSGHFLVPTAFLGTPGFATPEEISAISALGHVVGSHSHSHPVPMSVLPHDGLVREWRESIEILEAIVGENVTHASVPGGYTSRAVERAAARCGIRTLFTSAPTTRWRNVDGCCVLGRYTIRTPTTPDEVVSLVSGSGWARHRQVAGWSSRRAVKRLLASAYPKVRRAILDRRR